MLRYIVLILFFITSISYAYDFNNVEYVRNYDGDTITFNITDVHPLFGQEINIRVNYHDLKDMAWMVTFNVRVD